MMFRAVAAVLAAFITIFSAAGCKGSAGAGASDGTHLSADRIVQTKVTAAEWTDIQWEIFSCDAFSLSVPKGWIVDWNIENGLLSWSVHRPNSICCVSYLEQDHAAVSAEKMKALGTRSFTPKGSAEEYFFDMYNAEYEKKYPMTESYFSAESVCRLSASESLISELPDGRLVDFGSVYGEFSENGTIGEGVYSAAVFDTGSDLWTVRHIICERAQTGELTNWHPVFDKIFSSFRYNYNYKSDSGSDISGDMPETDTGLLSEALPDVRDISPLDAAMDSREKKRLIQQEKHSDIIGGYERVFDTESNRIYRAYRGFLEDHPDLRSRYIPIREAQYTDGYAGWITKVK